MRFPSFLAPAISLLALLAGCSSDDESPPAAGTAGTAGAGLAGSGQAGSGTAGQGQAGSGHAGSGQAGTAGQGQAGSGHAGSGNAGSGNAGSGGADPAGSGGTAGLAGSGAGQAGAAGEAGAAGSQAGGAAGSQAGSAGMGAAGISGAAGTGGAAGMGGSAGMGGATGTPSEQLVALYCGARAARVCQRFEGCSCPVPPDAPFDDAHCQARVIAACSSDFDPWKPAIDAGTVIFDPAAVGPCLDAQDAWSSPCERPRGLPPACLGVLSTAEAIGAPCSYYFCAGGQGVCDGPGSLCRPLSQKGEPCQEACAAGLACVGGVCTPTLAEGISCEIDQDCAPELRCSAGSCRAALPAQSPCQAPDACEGGLVCQDGFCQKPSAECLTDQDCGHLGHCVQPSKQRCQLPAAPGSPCGSSEECQAGAYCDEGTKLCASSPAKGMPCAQGAYCAAGLACHALDQVCVAIPQKGEPCAVGAETPFVCAAGLACVGETCAPPPAEGEACAGGNVCAAGLGCDFLPDGSFCVALRPAGGACQSDRVCAAGLHCSFESGFCIADFPEKTPCKEGNECGATQTCVPDEVGAYRCAPRPAQGEKCLFDCQPGLACHAELLPRLCSADACSAVFQP